MKYFFTAIVLLAFGFCSPQKEDTTAISINLNDGTWRVNYYWDQKDETSNFTTYAFMFGNGGVLMAHKGAATYTGAWNQTSSKLNINFTDPALSKLNNNWLITESSTNQIKLKEDDLAQDDQLHFTKN